MTTTTTGCMDRATAEELSLRIARDLNCLTDVVPYPSGEGYAVLLGPGNCGIRRVFSPEEYDLLRDLGVVYGLQFGDSA